MKADVLVLTLGLFCCLVVYSDACSCMIAHPQEQYCRSDFVILARVRREKHFNTTTIYKVRVRKEYKVSEKGVLALKSGRLITPSDPGVCGVRLQPGKVYVLSGRILSLKAHINLCNMILEWKDVSRRQRKGLKLLYSHGCSCQIKKCSGKCYRQPDRCNWSSSCQTNEGICLRHSANKSCMWTRSRALSKCMKEEGKKYAKTQKKGVS